MKMSLNILINERSIRKDGTCVIYFQYSFDRKRRPLLSTGIEIPPAFWDKKYAIIRQDLPLKFGMPGGLNYKTKKMFRVAEDLIIKF